jgi:hypothetical protein
VPFRACKVSFVDHGQRHEVDVDAESTYEAAVLALKAFGSRRYLKGPRRTAMLEIEVNRPARLLVELRVADVLRWLYEQPGATPEQQARKKRLRDLLADDRH